MMTEAKPTTPTKRPKRRAPALGAKIASAGMGASAMFGLVAVLGLASQQDAVPVSPEPAPAPVRPVVVVVHRSSGTAEMIASGDQSVSTKPGDVIELSANPVARTVQAPNASAVTNGSR